MKNRAVVILGVFAGVVVTLVVLLTVRAYSAQPKFLNAPNPNAFELLIAAASQSQSLPSSGTTNMAAHLERNRESLRLMREAMNYPSELPAVFYENQNSLVGAIQHMKRLAQVAKLEGTELERDGQHGEAAAAYLNIVRLGQKIEHGPALCLLIGIYVEKVGLDALDRVIPSLNEETRVKVAAELKSLRHSAVSLEDVNERERYFIQRTAPVVSVFYRWHPSVRKSMATIEAKLTRIRGDLEQTRSRLRQP